MTSKITANFKGFIHVISIHDSNLNDQKDITQIKYQRDGSGIRFYHENYPFFEVLPEHCLNFNVKVDSSSKTFCMHFSNPMEWNNGYRVQKIYFDYSGVTKKAKPLDPALSEFQNKVENAKNISRRQSDPSILRRNSPSYPNYSPRHNTSSSAPNSPLHWSSSSHHQTPSPSSFVHTNQSQTQHKVAINSETNESFNVNLNQQWNQFNAGSDSNSPIPNSKQSNSRNSPKLDQVKSNNVPTPANPFPESLQHSKPKLEPEPTPPSNKSKSLDLQPIQVEGNVFNDPAFPFLVNYLLLASKTFHGNLKPEVKQELKTLQEFQDRDPFAFLSSWILTVPHFPSNIEISHLTEFKKEFENLIHRNPMKVYKRAVHLHGDLSCKANNSQIEKLSYDFNDINIIHSIIPSDHIITINCHRAPIEPLFKCGFILFGRKYKLLALSSSDLRAQKARFVYEGKISVQKIREFLGTFHSIQNQFKFCARLGQSLSSGTPTIPICDSDFQVVDDLCVFGSRGDKKYEFTDGCGIIRRSFVQQIYEKYCEIKEYDHNRTYIPSGIQIRYRGFKGMLLTWNDEDGECIYDRRMREAFHHHKIVFTKSMEKFDITNEFKKDEKRNTLYVLNVSGPSYDATLNAQMMQILIDLHPNYKSQLDEIGDEIMQDYENILHDPQRLFQFFSHGLQEEPGTYAHTLALALFYGQDIHKNPWLWKQVTLSIKKSSESLKKLKFPISQSVNQLGVFDPTGTLKEDEIFFNCPGEFLSDGTEVLITRTPTVHPGDIQRVKFRRVSSLNPLRNVVVFSTKGQRPLPDKLSGGDLDGDRFFVCWDPRLVELLDAQRPADFDMEKHETHAAFDSSSEESVNQVLFDVFEEYRQHCNVGELYNLHSIICNTVGAKHHHAIKIAELASIWVDAAKNGVDLIKKNKPRLDEIRKEYKNYKECKKYKEDESKESGFKLVKGDCFLKSLSERISKRSQNITHQENLNNYDEDLQDFSPFWNPEDTLPEEICNRILTEWSAIIRSLDTFKNNDISQNEFFSIAHHKLRKLLDEECQKSICCANESLKIAVASTVYKYQAEHSSNTQWLSFVFLPELNSLKLAHQKCNQPHLLPFVRACK
eukprot:gb/GECH01013640.1/.p1 GENE.gb/GECH01013640.1/~~gb/GECH01013640.1/.p1  ORF type:complete len:1108 (+),score=260.03 gb/GECH01013640.1/:1-3324(+)